MSSLSDINPANANSFPSVDHLFGTDELGRDLWARTWAGTAISLLIGLLATLLSQLIGIALGVIAGMGGRKTNSVISGIVSLFTVVPSVIFVFLLQVWLGPGIPTLIIAIALTTWPITTKAVCNLTSIEMKKDYIRAAKAQGVSNVYIVFKHLLPNIGHYLLVEGVATLPRAILDESFLSFVGLGVNYPLVSLGQLCRSGAKFFRFYPYQFLIPSAILLAIVCSFFFFGDHFREKLNKKFRSEVQKRKHSLRTVLDPKPGKITMLFGRSGSGKTTLLKNILKERSRVGYLSQSAKSSLNPTQTIGQQFAGVLKNNLGITKSEAKQKAKQMFPDFYDSYPYQLSGGEAQRVATEIMFHTNNSAFVLDEPTSNLDAQKKKALYRRLEELKSQNKEIIIATHDVEDFNKIADYAYCIDDASVKKTVKPRRKIASCKKPKSSPDEAGHRTILKASGLCYGVLKQADITLYQDEIVTLIGENGSGKSTLCEILNRLAKPNSGTVWYVNGEETAAQEIQMVFQNYDTSLDYTKTVESIVEENMLIHHVFKTKSERHQEVLRLLNVVGLSDKYLGRHPKQLSGGEKQRVAIARALSAKPKILILDEATSALDSKTQANIMSLLLKIKKDTKLTILIVSHDNDFVEKYSDRIYKMEKGRVTKSA